MDSLFDRVLVLKRIGNTYYLPTQPLMEVEVEGSDVAPYFTVRVLDHDMFRGVLTVKREFGHWDEKDFKTSVEVNSEALEGVGIKKVLFAPKGHQEVVRKGKVPQAPYPKRIPVENYVVNVPSPATTVNRQTIHEEYDLSAADIKIEYGKATFKRFVSKLMKEVSFEVYNNFFKIEHDPVKLYFFKVFNAKKVKVAIAIEMENDSVVGQRATSEKLEAIDEAMLEVVIDKYIKEEILEADSGIYALEEKAANILRLRGEHKEEQLQALLNQLFAPQKTKHYNHLSYLSSKHHHNHMKLMITGSPLSYMFLLHGGTHFFFIWEPYSSDVATYIWKLKSLETGELQEEIKGILEKVKWLKKGNKTGYIKKGDPWHQKIIHDYQLPGNGFRKWQDQLKVFLGLLENQ